MRNTDDQQKELFHGVTHTSEILNFGLYKYQYFGIDAATPTPSNIGTKVNKILLLVRVNLRTNYKYLTVRSKHPYQHIKINFS